jgi:hypothetical protein
MLQPDQQKIAKDDRNLTDEFLFRCPCICIFKISQCRLALQMQRCYAAMNSTAPAEAEQ